MWSFVFRHFLAKTRQFSCMHLLEFQKALSCHPQRHILRDRRWSMTACPAYRAMGINEVKYSAWRGKKYLVQGKLEEPMQDKNLLNLHDQPNEPTKDGSLSHVLLESTFASVSTVTRGHTLSSLYSLSGHPSPLRGGGFTSAIGQFFGQDWIVFSDISQRTTFLWKKGEHWP